MAIDYSFRDVRSARQSVPQPEEAHSGGGVPPGSDVERRLTTLEADMKDVKAGIVELRVSAARTEALLGTVVSRLDRIDDDVKRTLALAVSKAIGPVQFVGILASSILVGGAMIAIWNWAAAHGWVVR